MEDSRYNIKLVKAFAEKAGTDLKAAETMRNSGDYSNAAYLAQQASEKITKCVLIINKKFERTHLVSGLLDEIAESLEEKWKTNLHNLIPLLEDLERHWNLPRYPEPYEDEIWNPVEEYKLFEGKAFEAMIFQRKIILEDAEDAIKKAKVVLETLSKFMNEYYHIDL